MKSGIALMGFVVVSQLQQFEAFGQCTPASSRTWISVRDNGTGSDTLWFGFDALGTYGLDPHLCEYEIPTTVPSGVFDTRWLNIPGRDGLDTPEGLGMGFGKDFRQRVCPVNIDTFKVRFLPGFEGFPMTLDWSTAGIVAMSDSAWLQDEFGGIIFRVRMHAVNNFVQSNPAFSAALIIIWTGGTDNCVEVNEENGVPKSSGLSQNYPNPFNPSTTISFNVGTYGDTSLRVFNLLGQEVAVLVNEKLNAGQHSVEFNAEGLPSGVYYYRLVAGEYSATKKLMVLK